jgi:hypothetical protein
MIIIVIVAKLAAEFKPNFIFCGEAFGRPITRAWLIFPNFSPIAFSVLKNMLVSVLSANSCCTATAELRRGGSWMH